MRIRDAWCVLALLLAPLPAWAATDPCLAPGQDMPALSAMKAAGFVVADPAAKTALADTLVGCLGSADPVLRDGIAYEALSTWMRAGDFDPPQLRALRTQLYAALEAPDAAGFRGPFAALVLSEVARTDRIAPWMSADERADMLERAAAYVEQVRDYRGYDAAEGWRHGVAHGADWLMQLAMNPALAPPQLHRILGAVASQAVPSAPHAYVFGEPGRLARPVLFVARHEKLQAADWQAWFATLAPRLGDRQQDMAGWLARRHDLQAFLSALYLDASRSEDPGIRAMLPALVAALDGG